MSHNKYVSFSFDKKPHSTIIAGTFALSNRKIPLDSLLILLLSFCKFDTTEVVILSARTLESDVNLSFGLKFNDILKLNGYDTVLTRNDKNDIADKSLDTIAKRKKSDMYKNITFSSHHISSYYCICRENRNRLYTKYIIAHITTFLL